MTGKESNPPRLAIWLLHHVCPGSDNEALAGDLVERFREGQTRGWFWRQVLIAFAIGMPGEIRAYWPQFCYAIAGVAISVFFAKSVHEARLGVGLRWWKLPWPWSQLVMELSPTALLALAALPVLAAGLVINRTFRWISPLRTAVINLALITLGHYLLDVCPWLFRPVPGDLNHSFLIIAPVFQVLLFFSTFLVSAWLGCRSPRRMTHPANPPKPA